MTEDPTSVVSMTQEQLDRAFRERQHSLDAAERRTRAVGLVAVLPLGLYLLPVKVPTALGLLLLLPMIALLTWYFFSADRAWRCPRCTARLGPNVRTPRCPSCNATVSWEESPGLEHRH